MLVYRCCIRLKVRANLPWKSSSAPASQPFDNFSGMEERLKTFDLELGMPGNDAQDDDYDSHHQSAQDEERRTVIIETPNLASKIGAVDLPASASPKIPIGVETSDIPLLLSRGVVSSMAQRLTASTNSPECVRPWRWAKASIRASDNARMASSRCAIRR
jgi:hypothetical protein